MACFFFLSFFFLKKRKQKKNILFAPVNISEKFSRKNWLKANLIGLSRETKNHSSTPPLQKLAIKCPPILTLLPRCFQQHQKKKKKKTIFEDPHAMKCDRAHSPLFYLFIYFPFVDFGPWLYKNPSIESQISSHLDPNPFLSIFFLLSP